MKHLLYVEASPRKERSASIEVALSFLDSLAKHEEIAVDTLDLWSTPLPEFDGSALAAKYAGLSGAALTPDQASAWAAMAVLVNRFRAADILLFALPLWNFGVPYKMKHLIDVVSQKDLLFSFDERGFGGLLVGKKAVVVYARGLDYSRTALTPAETFDFQRPYMEMWLKFIGVTDIESIVIEKTLFGSEIDREARARAKQEAAELAGRVGR